MSISFFTRHNFGYTFPEGKLPTTAEEAMKEAELNWSVEKEEMFLEDGTKVPDAYAMRRSDEKQILLGVVGKRYTPLQNIDAFSFFDPIVKDGLAEYHIAGSSFNGAKVWIMAKFKDDVVVADDDIVRRYLLLSSSHDGSGSVVACVTPIRAICSNALSSLIRQAKRDTFSNYISIRHTKSITERVQHASQTMKMVDSSYNQLGDVWKQMAELEMPPTSVSNYFKKIVPDNPNSENPYKTQAVRTMLHQYLQSGLGSELGHQHTLWGAYNAVTEYMTHEMSDRKGNTFDKHMDSVWFGPRGKKNDVAMKVALELLGD